MEPANPVWTLLTSIQRRRPPVPSLRPPTWAGGRHSFWLCDRPCTRKILTAGLSRDLFMHCLSRAHSIVHIIVQEFSLHVEVGSGQLGPGRPSRRAGRSTRDRTSTFPLR